jgi:hypothetical protein
MVLARVADTLTHGDSAQKPADDRRRHVAIPMQGGGPPMADTAGAAGAAEIDDEAARPPYLHVRMPGVGERDVN